MSKTVRIYRYETPDGLGMYTNGPAGTLRCCPSSDNDHRHPSPGADGQLIRQVLAKNLGRGGDPHQRYGFRSKRQALKWVWRKKYRQVLHDAGFILSVYEVPKDAVALGVTQVIFDVRRAKRVGRLCSVDLTNIEGL